MLDPDELRLAVDLHRRSYNLLKWLETAIEKGTVTFDRAHETLDEAGAAKDWLEACFHKLPGTCRPARAQLDAFARFLATYLLTSFDLAERPGKVLWSDGCSCPFCTYLVAAPHLQPKQVTSRDKAQARRLKAEHLLQLAVELRLPLGEDEAERLAIHAETTADAALAAYGEQLVARPHGRSEGPAVLALWREIAWDRAGSPKRGFKLEAGDILGAEQRLAEHLRCRPGDP